MKGITYSYPIKRETRLLYFYEKLAIINSLGISLADELICMGINKACLYGYGMIGEILDSLLNGSDIITCIYDKKLDERNDRYVTLDALLDSDVYVLLSPINNVKEISEALISKGISRKRIISACFLIDQIYEKAVNNTLEPWDINRVTFLVTGASFKNKGAQSMLFVTMNELKKRYPGCNIFFAPENSISEYLESDIQKYKFRIIRGGRESYSDLYDVLPITSAIIDISGYSVTSDGYNDQIRNTLTVAVDYDIPLYLMPQSYGPLNFKPSDRQLFINGLSHARIVFAREENGKRLLEKQFGLKNVVLSNDIVIQNRSLDRSNIYKKGLEPARFVIESKHNVAIVPNIRNYEFGNKKEILEGYRSIIDRLIECNKTVYVVCHSNDEIACMDICDMYPSENKVRTIDLPGDCLEFCDFLGNCEFVVGSRYHSLVHSLVSGVPCIAIGWAIKYKELMSGFGQSKYCFDVKDGIDRKELVNKLDYMIDNYMIERKMINSKLEECGKDSVFDLIGGLD